MTTKNTKRGKSKSGKRAARIVATRKDERVPAFAYDERVPAIASALRKFPQRSATVAELFAELESPQFRTERRIAATLRQRPHECHAAGIERDGAMIVLRKSQRAVSGGKRKSGNVSKRATRSAR